jgi:2-keto-3-deoxy-L-rhamnonate aldolase RhmA
VFVGPMDLTTSMGIPGQYDDARFHDALGEVADAAQSAGKAAGILLLDPANLPLVRELGYTVVALGSDGGAVQAGLRASLETLGGAGPAIND